MELLNEYIPPMFDEENCFSLMPLKFDKSINTFLHKEVQRYNQLIKTVITSLKDTQKAILGIERFTSETEETFYCL